MDSFDEASSAARDSAVPSEADLGASPPSNTTPSSILNYCTLPRQYNHPMASSSSGCSSTETPPLDFLLFGNGMSALHQSADQHSSEEELEVINGPKSSGEDKKTAVTVPLLVRPTTSAPEKRKWSEANQQRSCDNDGSAYSAPVSRVGRETGSGSSDEEVCCFFFFFD